MSKKSKRRENNPTALARDGSREEESTNRHVYIEPGVKIDLVDDLKEQQKAAQTDGATHQRKQLFWTKVAAALLLCTAGFSAWQAYLTHIAITESRENFQRDQRAWIGVGEGKDSVFVSPIQFDADLNATVMYGVTLENFSSHAAQNAFAIAQLVLTQDLFELAKVQKAMCAMRGDDQVGDLIFPGKSKPPTGLWPGTSDAAKHAAGKPLEAFLVGCISYSDQFTTVWHTGFIYWFLDSQTGHPLQIIATPNTQFNGIWQEWHSSLYEEESIVHKKIYGD
jgi:hypothetical protein